jgi:hypothetical protein
MAHLMDGIRAAIEAGELADYSERILAGGSPYAAGASAGDRARTR